MVFLLREWVLANQPLEGGNQGRNGAALRAAARPPPLVAPPPAATQGGVQPLQLDPDIPTSETNTGSRGRRRSVDHVDTLSMRDLVHRNNATAGSPSDDSSQADLPAVPLSEAAQAFIDRQRQMTNTAAEDALIDRINEQVYGEQGPEGQASSAALALPRPDVRADVADDRASQHSSDSDDSLDHGHPAGQPRRPGDIAAADLAAIDAAEAEEDVIFLEADLFGIFEAIGLLGPIIALVQNAALMTLLIITLLAAAIWAPLMLGKTISAVSTES